MLSPDAKVREQPLPTRSYCTDMFQGTACGLIEGHEGDHERVLDGVTMTWSDPLELGICEGCGEADVPIVEEHGEELCVACDQEARHDH